MSQSNRRNFLRTVGIGSAGLLAGCTALPGGGGGSGDETITIAATVSQSGNFSDAGSDVETAYELGETVINENGGILDRDVEVIIRDDESDPSSLQEALNGIISNNDVDMIWGTFGSLLVAAAANVAEENEIPMLSANFSYEEPHRNNGYEWTYAPFHKSRDAANGARKLAALAPEDNKPTNVGIWQTNTGWGEELAQRWIDELEPEGYEIVLNEKFQLNSQDFSTLISQAESAGVEYLLSNPSPGGAITAVQQMEEVGWHPKMATWERGPTVTTWWEATGTAGALYNCGPGWVPGAVYEGTETMLEAFRSREGVSSDAYPSPTVGGSYNVTQTAKQAFEAAGSTEPDDVQQALDDTTFSTVIGEFGFDEYGMPVEGDLAPPMGQWQDEQLRLVVPADVDSERSTDFQYPMPPYDER